MAKRVYSMMRAFERVGWHSYATLGIQADGEPCPAIVSVRPKITQDIPGGQASQKVAICLIRSLAPLVVVSTMRFLPALSTLALAAALTLPTASLHAETAYALDSRNLLLRFDTNTPGFTDSTQVIRGLQPGESILGIDFRPANGMLYGLGSTSRLYTIDIATGMARPVAAAPFTPALEGTEFGFDFNPTVDRIRLVSNTGQNLRLHPDTGLVAAVDARLNRPGSDRLVIVGAAYTNSVPGATSTTLYTIDAETRALQTQVPPNDGTQNRVGMTNIDMSELAGFDISPTTGIAYIATRVRGSNASALYQVSLTNADTTLIGVFDRADQVSGLALPIR